MSIPDFQTIMLPLLQFMGDGKEHSTHEMITHLALFFQLSPEELNEMLPSGTQTVFYNRVGWARTYLSKSGLLETVRRTYYQINKRGSDILQRKPTRIDINFLQQFPEFVEFRERKQKQTIQMNQPVDIATTTPEERLEDAYQEIQDSLLQDLLFSVKNCSPAFFERLVVELLVKMGYGGSRKDAAKAVGQSGDEGIDGIIDEDRLGLDAVYIQAKRWEGVVGRPEIQKFVGALMGKRARKGIFITTSDFTTEAKNFILTIDYRIILITGKRLAELMFDYDIGVSEVSSYKLKRIDSDYFSNN